MVNLTINAQTNISLTPPDYSTAFYIASNQNIRLSLYGSGTAVDGLSVPPNKTTLYTCKPPLPNCITLYNPANIAAKVSIQFLRGN
ncbi:hypothetical protein B7486_45705 [cyanobacterium TDX16]|nr:hypothetical protein B7486_45705 [cyanobacterium TDX16]